MQNALAILSLLIAALGWYYLFYSRAAKRLESIEDQRTNRFRGVLRRVNAIVMLLMALGIALGTYHFDPDQDRIDFALVWLGVVLLLMVCVILALIDLRLTIKLRTRLRERDKP